MLKHNGNINFLIENKANLSKIYSENLDSYESILKNISLSIEKTLKKSKLNAVLKGRVKTFENFFKKLLVRSQSVDLNSPFSGITDIIGLRIVVPFLADLETVESILNNNYEVTEIDHKSKDFTIREFGYDSTHLLIKIPDEFTSDCRHLNGLLIEVQIRTVLQDAWAEVEHELVYKTSIDKVEDSIKRKMLALNATLSLADITFQEIRDLQRKKYTDLQEKHKKLLNKVSTIPEKWGIPEDTPEEPEGVSIPNKKETVSDNLNDLFVEALNAHLENRLDEAIDLYTKLIIISPNHYLLNHRGLVYFTLSEYEKAAEDFSKAIEMEPKDTRVYTNRGLAYRMLGKYDLALTDFEKSLDLNPLWPDTFYGRALTYFDMGNVSSAVEDCDRALSIKPDFKQAARFKQYILNQSMN